MGSRTILSQLSAAAGLAYRTIGRLTMAVASGSLIIICGVAMYAVVIRYVFSGAFVEAQELVSYGLTWTTILGASLAYRVGEHVSLGIGNLMPRRARDFTPVFSHLMVLVFALLLVYYGWQLVDETSTQRSPALHLSTRWLYGSIPALGVLLTFDACAHIARLLRHPGRLRQNAEPGASRVGIADDGGLV